MINLPDDFKTKYQQLLGDDYAGFIASFNDAPQKGYRYNTLKTDHNPIKQTDQPTPFAKNGYYGQVEGHSAAHINGLVYSQEPSAQFIGTVVNAQPGETILDLAAAPGGKTTQIAADMQGQGLLVTNEINRKRAGILSENVERMGIKNAIVTSHDSEQLTQHFPSFFDKILLDAPCSGEGMFHKDPDAIDYWSLEYPEFCANRQRDILTQTIKMLKPGGELIYSTCTFSPEENEMVIAWLLDTYPQFETIPIEKPVGVMDGRPDWVSDSYDESTRESLKHTARLWPQHLDGEGHFVAKLRKRSNKEPADALSKQHPLESNLNQSQLKIWQAFESETLNSKIEKDALYAFGDTLYWLPTGTPEAIQHLKVLRLGVQLGMIKRDRFQPSHSLALALAPDEAQHTYALDDQQWREFMHGDTFSIDPAISKNWHLLTNDGFATGWGKAVNGQMKNFYPKGLRFTVK